MQRTSEEPKRQSVPQQGRCLWTVPRASTHGWEAASTVPNVREGEAVKRAITRTVEIDCEDETCGRCKEREDNHCWLFGLRLHSRAYKRLPECKAAEVRKP